MIVRWGLDALPSVLAEVGSEEPLLVTTERWRGLDLPAANAFYGVESHGSPESVAEATAAAEGADGLLAVGGGSAIDTAKAVSAATGLPVVSVPTTYSGAEWTRGFGIRKCFVNPPLLSTRRFWSRMLAKVPRIITSWLPRRDP